VHSTESLTFRRARNNSSGWAHSVAPDAACVQMIHGRPPFRAPKRVRRSPQGRHSPNARHVTLLKLRPCGVSRAFFAMKSLSRRVFSKNRRSRILVHDDVLCAIPISRSSRLGHKLKQNLCVCHAMIGRSPDRA